MGGSGRWERKIQINVTLSYECVCMCVLHIYIYTHIYGGAIAVKNPPANGGDIRDAGSIPGSRRSPGGGHGNPFQYSCLENPMDRGAWRATVHRGTKSQTRLK